MTGPEVVLRCLVALALLVFAYAAAAVAAEQADQLDGRFGTPCVQTAISAFVILLGAWLVFSPVLR